MYTTMFAGLQVNFFLGKNLAHSFSSAVFKVIILLNAYQKITTCVYIAQIYRDIIFYFFKK